MITVINKIKKPSKTKGFLPSGEEYMYQNVIPKYIKKVKAVNSNGVNVTVTFLGTPEKFELAVDSDDPVIVKKIQAACR